MLNSEFIEALAKLPQDLPVIFKVAQEITGYENFSWMRGECTGVSVENLYQGDDDEYWDHDRMFDEVNDDPEKYGLSKDATDADVENYIDLHKKETVIAVQVNP